MFQDGTALIKRYKYNIADKKIYTRKFKPRIEFPEFKSIKVLETTVKSHDGLDIPLSIIYNKRIKSQR